MTVIQPTFEGNLQMTFFLYKIGFIAEDLGYRFRAFFKKLSDYGRLHSIKLCRFWCSFLVDLSSLRSLKSLTWRSLLDTPAIILFNSQLVQK